MHIYNLLYIRKRRENNTAESEQDRENRKTNRMENWGCCFIYMSIEMIFSLQNTYFEFRVNENKMDI